MNSKELAEYKYNGARSMVLLHAKYLSLFLQTWRDAKNKNIVLPKTEDPDYESMETLLHHVFRAARGYMTWICEKLNLPDPGIKVAPEATSVEEEADEYLQHLLEKWQLPLTEVEEEKFHPQTYTSRWGAEYCIDAMLEHAVMHPIRHEFQLKNLMVSQRT